MVGLGEVEALDDAVHLLEVALVEVDERLGLQHRLVAVQQLARGQRPQESEERKEEVNQTSVHCQRMNA